MGTLSLMGATEDTLNIYGDASEAHFLGLFKIEDLITGRLHNTVWMQLEFFLSLKFGSIHKTPNTAVAWSNTDITSLTVKLKPTIFQSDG